MRRHRQRRRAGRVARCRWTSAPNGNGSVTLEVEGDRVGVAAVEETNTLLVRATAQRLEVDPAT